VLMVLGSQSKFLDNQQKMMGNQSLLNGSSMLMLRESVEIVTFKKISVRSTLNYLTFDVQIVG